MEAANILTTHESQHVNITDEDDIPNLLAYQGYYSL
jgi:hypothetical protein